MKTKNIFRYVVLIGVFLVLAAPAMAQVNRSGTAAASELLIPVGARGIAMGSTPIATASGVDALFWNPGGVARMKSSTEVTFTNMSYFGDISVNYGAIAANFSSLGTLAISLKSLSFGDIPITTTEDPDGLSGQVYSPTYVTLGVTYARALTDVINVGVTVSLVSEQIARVSSSGVAFTAGIQYDNLAGIDGLAVGVALKNIGSKMQFDGSGLYVQATPEDANRPAQLLKVQAASYDLPSTMEIGLGYTRKVAENVPLQLSALFVNNNLGIDEYRVGAELGYEYGAASFYGRGGYNFVSSNQKDNFLFGGTVGFGLKYQMSGMGVVFDYGWRQVKYFGGNNVFTIGLSF